MSFPIALQLYSVRDDMAADFEGTLKKVKELGFDGVEFAGLFGHSAEEIKAMCDEIGLTPISAHIPFGEMLANPAVIEIYAKIGCKFVVMPYLEEAYRPGNEKYGELVSLLTYIGEKANELGLKFAYHNHDFEFEKVDGEYMLDILYREIPAALLQPQLDTCWVNVGGENPAEYIRKYSGRMGILHLKDFVGGKSENMYALIGIDENEKKDTAGKFEFRPLGKGVQDFPAILVAAQDAGVEWVVIEQDEPSMNKTPLECAEISINYLKSL